MERKNTARIDALGDVLDALQRAADAGALATSAGRTAASSVASGLQRLAAQAGALDLSDAIVEFQVNWSL